MSEEKKDLENSGEITAVVIDGVAAKLKQFNLGDDMIAKIKEVTGIESAEDLGFITEKDLSEAGVKPIQARKILASFVLPAEPTASVLASKPVFNPYSESILPTLPDDEAWLKDLKTSGVLKVEKSTTISAMHALLAYKLGLYDVVKKVVMAMEEFSARNEQPVDPVIFELRNQITTHRYGDLFAAIPGFNASYITDAERKEFLNRVNDIFLPELARFYEQLKTWNTNWQSSFTVRDMAAAMAGRVQSSLPDTGILHDSADAVNDAINKAFCKYGIQTSAALSQDATQILKSLGDPRLPALIGEPNREQMLKRLGIGVNATYPRLEQLLTRFVIAVLNVDILSGGESECDYFEALYQLGSQISWDAIGISAGAGITGIGGRKL